MLDPNDFVTELADQIAHQLRQKAGDFKAHRLGAIALDAHPWHRGMSLSLLIETDGNRKWGVSSGVGRGHFRGMARAKARATDRGVARAKSAGQARGGLRGGPGQSASRGRGGLRGGPGQSASRGRVFRGDVAGRAVW